MVDARHTAKPILLGAVVLLAVQAARAGLLLGLERIFSPMGLSPLFLRAFSFSVIVAGFCLVAKPGPAAIGLRSPRRGFLSLGGTALSGSIWLAFLGVSAYFGAAAFAEKAFSGIVVAFAEEALCRGLIWGAVEDTWERPDGAGGRGGGAFAAFAATTVLYAFWHLGYADIVAAGLGWPGAHASGRLALALGGRAIAALVLGALAGGARAGTGSIWMSFFIHGTWNIIDP